MRIKADFVTNSSSVAYILEARYPIYRKDIRWSFHKWENLRCFWTKKQLIAYTQHHKTDWINIARGPDKFYNLHEGEYQKCLEIIKQGKVAVYARCDQHRDYTKFISEIENRGARTLHRESQ